MNPFLELLIVYGLVLFSNFVEVFVLKRPSFVLHFWFLLYGYYFILSYAVMNVFVYNESDYFYVYYIFTILWSINGLNRIAVYYKTVAKFDSMEEYTKKIKEEMSNQKGNE